MFRSWDFQPPAPAASRSSPAPRAASKPRSCVNSRDVGTSSCPGRAVGRQLKSLADGLPTIAHVVPADLADRDARVPACCPRSSRVASHRRSWSTTLVCPRSVRSRSDPAAELSMVEVDLAAVCGLCSRFLPGMVERGQGAVLNVASTAAFQPLRGAGGVRRQQGVRALLHPQHFRRAEGRRRPPRVLCRS